MTDILIRSHHGDVHTDAVSWALGRLGYEVAFWPSGDFPGEQGWSAEIDADGRALNRVRLCGCVLDLQKPNVVWNRRGQSPHPSNSLDHEDAVFAERESRTHIQALIRTVAPCAFWVNPPEVADGDSFKPLQLLEAVKAGLRVPPTLFSNDPETIRDFYRRMKGAVVYKSYHGASWTSASARQPPQLRAVNRTVPVRPEDLEKVSALAAAPGIFQRAIPKAFELRVTAMGKTLVAAKINSQKHEMMRQDWRSGHHVLELEPFTLPAEIAAACRRYMRSSGLNFGCFDFIVTPEGKYYFLEVNQAGQFLWKEGYCPMLPLLQIFCDFLISADPDFIWKERPLLVTMAAYRASDAGRAFEARARASTRSSL